MNILIADDHPLVRAAMVHVVKRLADDVNVVEVGDYQAVLDAFCLDETSFDLALIDLSMPGREECGDISALIRTAADTPVVVLSATESDEEALAVIDSGARGFIPKSVQSAVILAALQLVVSGGVFIPVEMMGNITNETTQPVSNANILTRRQKEVVTMLAAGKSNKEISRDLGISEGTIRTHIAAIYIALKVNNRTQAGNVARGLNLFV